MPQCWQCRNLGSARRDTDAGMRRGHEFVKVKPCSGIARGVVGLYRQCVTIEAPP